MRTVEWIAKNKDKRDGNARSFNSVYQDGAGTTYSYGGHYPLLFKLNGHWFVNNRGYSVTTAKHINWAHQATDYPAYDIRVPSHHHGRVNEEDAKAWLSDQITELVYTMARKTRKNTNVYANLERELASATRALKLLKGGN